MNYKKIAILLPCYNEGLAINAFNKLLVDNLQGLDYNFELIYINDGSLDDTKYKIESFEGAAPNINIYLLDLKYNMGHQKAIYQGFLHVKDEGFNNILIMDSDGEDAPEAIKEILKYDKYDLVQVVRGKRNESLFFRVFYYIYKLFFLLIIGKKLNFGNYSLVKPKLIDSAVENSFSHLAAFLNNQRASRVQVVWDRSKRIDGESKMNFTNLFYHAVNSFAENAQNLLFVFIKLSILLLLGIMFLTSIILYKKFIAYEAILGWSSSLLAILFNSLLISLGVFVIGSLQLNIMSKQYPNKKDKLFTLHSIIKKW